MGHSQGGRRDGRKGRGGGGWRGLDQRGRALWLCGLILLLGLGSASAVWIVADNASESGYKEAYGGVYQDAPVRTKKFVRELEVIGGKANVLVYDLMFWFEGLWRGKRLAGTLAALTLLVAGVVYYFGVHLAPYRDEDEGQDPAQPPPPAHGGPGGDS